LTHNRQALKISVAPLWGNDNNKYADTDNNNFTPFFPGDFTTYQPVLANYVSTEKCLKVTIDATVAVRSKKTLEAIVQQTDDVV
jgi:hypothetical protein